MKRMSKILCILACFMIFASTSFAASILVTWTANSESDLAGYSIYDKVGSGTNTKVGTVGVMTSPSFTIPNVAEGLHTITVTAFDTATNVSLPSDPATITVDTTAPAKPAKPTLTIN